MKTGPIDFILSITAMLTILAAALLFSRGCIVPLSTRTLGEYHVIADTLGLLLIYGVFSGVFARALLIAKPWRAGEYGMDSSEFTYWKLYSVIFAFGRGALLPFTTVITKPLIPKLFGARIGKGVAIGGGIADAPLVSIGDGSVLGHNASITAHAISSGRIILREVKIGRGVTIGVNALIWPGVEIGDGAIITAGAVVPIDTRVGANELWGGVPARKLKDIQPDDPRG